MLDYLVTSSVRRRLLLLLFGPRAVSGTAGELAKRANVAFSHAHGELKDILGLGWVTVTRNGTREVYAANPSHPQTRLVRELVEASQGSRAHERSASPEAATLFSQLKGLGAPLPNVASAPLVDRDEVDVLAAGAAYSRRDPTVARALPVAVWKARNAISAPKLAAVSARPEDKHALGFMLELAGDLGGDRRLVGVAESLRDRRFRSVRPFFYGSDKALEFPLARKWGFSINMERETFASLFYKFVRVD